MKRLLTLLLLATLFISCSSDDDKEDTPTVTSFTITNPNENTNHNVVMACVSNGEYKRIASFGDIAYNTTTKEVVIDNDVKSLIMFYDVGEKTFKLNFSFNIISHKLNSFTLPTHGTADVVKDKTDPKQYPQ